tara:strand:+ start:1209 stop:1505 length:297 start_codon:yes stop_codon:yes gene_type:complete
MGYRKGYYRKDGTYVQGHYTNRTSSKLKSKSKKGCSFLLIAVLMVLSIEACTPDGGCSSKKCYDFNSQSEAQAAFNGSSTCLENLEADDDRTAYEKLT